MEYVVIALKLIVGISILNVWLVRSNKSTPWRGGNAGSIGEEFKAYGLPQWSMWTVGTLKVVLALVLLFSIYDPGMENIAAIGIALMMLGAVGMHFKIGDPHRKSLPAFTFLVLSLVIAFL
jgi:hypothetical protein